MKKQFYYLEGQRAPGGDRKFNLSPNNSPTASPGFPIALEWHLDYTIMLTTDYTTYNTLISFFGFR